MITLTEQAAKRVQNYLTKRGKGVGIRLGVKTTGCSGLAYQLEYVDSAEETDLVFESNGANVYVDPKSFAYLNGLEINYVRQGLNEGFEFTNPNSKGECGCGESFRV
jgi:iron-sulfur cluster assembly protein